MSGVGGTRTRAGSRRSVCWAVATAARSTALGLGLGIAALSTLGTLASEDSFHALGSAAAGSICSKSMAVGLHYLKCSHFTRARAKKTLKMISVKLY